REPSTPWLIPALAGTAVVGVAFYLLHARDVPAKSPNAVAPRAVDSAPAAAAPAPRADSLADTLAASPLLAANPEDSARASAYAIELWRSTTYEGAVARVDRDWPTLPAVSITPMVTAAGDSVLWYKVSAGAYTDSNTAMSRRATLRARGGGTLDLPIVRAPYALRVVQGVQIDSLGRYGAELRARQLPAYALLQLDGRANIYLGAFETLQQANAYRRRLRSQGLMPPIVFRVGEPYAMPRKP
ncbi:MAG TPA: hypothetical protein VKA84_28505, partial [Gemmatimonadaceae bacterium]|nr:hypothetical protein [Gemmatimonadaceae bacterium]